MSSKLNVKQSKKERPRSSDKLKKGRRDGTPEKSNTPNASQDALPEEGLIPEKKPVIINDEILALQIKPENLEKLREPRPPSGDKRRSPESYPVVVRKLKPASEWDKPPPKLVTVAKPAPPDAPLKPVDYTDAAGLRFDVTGRVIPHSILGSVDDYKREAARRGDLPPELAKMSSFREDSGTLTVKYEKKKRNLSKFPKFESVDESNALKNWQKRMMDRRKQQDHLSKMLNKAPDQLVMNQSDDYRKTQELRYKIDRTIPTMDYGKGYRIGSEFWKQQERVGDDLTGIHMTMSQTEKGYPPPMEHVGVPAVVQKEKGTDWEKPRTPFHKPWHKSPYLKDRQTQLDPVMKELDPHEPDVLNLEIVGSNQPSAMYLPDTFSEGGLTEYEEQRREFLEREQELLEGQDEDQIARSDQVFGPSLKFASQAARWTGDSTSFVGQKGIEARVSFEAYAGDRVTSFLEIVNDGTTCVYYQWKKVPKTNPFEMMAAKVQRFYFNTSSGVILPGDTIKFPFVFKSPNAGVFSEQWRFETKPVVCGGAALVVTLRGVSLQKDKFKHQRTELEQELARKQAEQIVRGILDGILDSIRPLERPRSPIDAYITEEEVFSRKNPGRHYNSEVVEKIKTLYKELFKKEPVENPDEPEEPGEEVEWNLSVQELKQEIMVLDDEDEKKQDLLQQLNSGIITLSFPVFTPGRQQMYNVGYQILSELVDDIVLESTSLRTSMGMPEREADDIPEDSSDGRKKGQQAGRAPDKKGGGKDSKSSAKPGSKDTSRTGKSTPGKQSAKASTERPSSAQSGSQSPTYPSGDPILEAKYKEKIYTQAFLLLETAIDKMTTVFDEVQAQEGGPRLPVLI